MYGVSTFDFEDVWHDLWKVVNGADNVVSLSADDEVTSVTRVRPDQHSGPTHRISRLYVLDAIVGKDAEGRVLQLEPE